MLRSARTLFRFSHRRLRTGLAIGVLLCTAGLVAVNLWAWSQYRSAEQALREDRTDEAHSHISQCLRVWPRGAATHFLAARIERVSGHYPEAEQHLKECIHLRRGASEATQLEEVLLRAQTGELKEVEAGLWKCVETGHPESSQILETLARVYLRDSRMRSALMSLDRWLEREPRTARALHWRGQIAERLRQMEKAIADYQEALELDPGRWSCRLQFARLLLDQHNLEEALPHLEELRRGHADDPAVLVALAQCHQLQGEEQQAIQLLDRTLASQPNYYEALVLRGQLACQQNQPAEGEVWLRRALAQHPMDGRALYAFYRSLEQQGKESEAAKILTRHRSVEADTARLTDLMTRQIDQPPGNPDVLSEVGAISLRLGEDKVGLEWLYRALRENENHRPTHEILLRYYETRGDDQMATRHRLKLARINDRTSPLPVGQR